MLYSCIITTKDRLESLKRLIASIEANTKDYELIVVNDASTDGTSDWLAKQHVRYSQYNNPQPYQSISYTTSIPVAIAWNLGCEVASGEFIQILNGDMEETEGWLEQQKQLYDYLTTSGRKVGVLAAKLLRGDEVLSRGGAFQRTQLVPVPAIDEVQEVDYSNTPFFKKKVWKDVGGFIAYDQLYYEDASFGLQCQKFGLINYYNPLSIIGHDTLGFYDKDGEEQVKRRKHNESIIQQRAREKFMIVWKDYLEDRGK